MEAPTCNLEDLKDLLLTFWWPDTTGCLHMSCGGHTLTFRTVLVAQYKAGGFNVMVV